MTTPLPYQHSNVRAIVNSIRARRSHLDCSSTGCGKTYMSLFAAKEVSQNVVVIAPISVHNDWREAAEKTGARVLWIANIEALKRSDALTSSVVRKKKIYTWNPVPLDTVLIVDEFHRCGGNSEYSQIVRDFPNKGRTIMLSATPCDSVLKVKTLAAVLGICPPNLFWSWVQKTYKARKGFFGGLQISKANDKAALVDFRERMVRSGQISGLVKSELGDAFPKVQVLTKVVDVANPRELDRAYLEDLKALQEQADDAENQAVAFLRSRQMAEMSMIPTIEEQIDLLTEQGFRVIVFVNYKATLHAIPNLEVRYHGELPADLRLSCVQMFQRDEVKTFGATSSCGGESITLDDQDGDKPRAIMLCPGVSAREVIQCIGRGNRAKSKSDLLVYILFPNCPSGERIRSIVASKTDRLESLVDTDLM